MFENRTDLALEERESFEGNGGEIGGVAIIWLQVSFGNIFLVYRS